VKFHGVSDTVPFGKYKGKTVGEVMKENPSYLAWWRHAQMTENGRPASEVMVPELHVAINVAIELDPKLKKKFPAVPVPSIPNAADMTVGEVAAMVAATEVTPPKKGSKAATSGIAKGAAAAAMAALKSESEPAPWEGSSTTVIAPTQPTTPAERYADWGGF
jgi:uncharacterized protein (DUF3820 family)